jgi:hypothetical protein
MTKEKNLPENRLFTINLPETTYFQIKHFANTYELEESEAIVTIISKYFTELPLAANSNNEHSSSLTVDRAVAIELEEIEDEPDEVLISFLEAPNSFNESDWQENDEYEDEPYEILPGFLGG